MKMLHTLHVFCSEQLSPVFSQSDENSSSYFVPLSPVHLIQGKAVKPRRGGDHIISHDCLSFFTTVCFMFAYNSAPTK